MTHLIPLKVSFFFKFYRSLRLSIFSLKYFYFIFIYLQKKFQCYKMFLEGAEAYGFGSISSNRRI